MISSMIPGLWMIIVSILLPIIPHYFRQPAMLLSVFLVATLATYFANYIKEHKWLGYVGIFVIIIVALQLIIGGLVNLDVLTINEKYEVLFSV